MLCVIIVAKYLLCALTKPYKQYDATWSINWLPDHSPYISPRWKIKDDPSERGTRLIPCRVWGLIDGTACYTNSPSHNHLQRGTRKERRHQKAVVEGPRSEWLVTERIKSYWLTLAISTTLRKKHAPQTGHLGLPQGKGHDDLRGSFRNTRLWRRGQVWSFDIPYDPRWLLFVGNIQNLWCA